MILTFKHTIVCDDIRKENNGKRLLIGVYNDSILLPAFPCTLAALCFFVIASANETGEFPVSVSLELPSKDKPVVNGSGKVGIKKTGATQLVFRFPSVLLEGPGKCILKVRVGAEEEQTIAEIALGLYGHGDSTAA